MNKEQKKDMYQFYLKMFLISTVIWFLVWISTDYNGGKQTSILGFTWTTLMIMHWVFATYKGKL
jgi:hypothetical protein